MGFRRRRDEVVIDLSPPERNVLRMVPDLLEDLRPSDAGADRLRYVAHADDDDAEERYRELVGDALDNARLDDRRLFAGTIDAESMDVEQAEAWMRVVGEARLVLAARLGITEDGWEETIDPSEGPEVAILGFLGWVQDSLVQVLSR
jgi:hypothetical protein